MSGIDWKGDSNSQTCRVHKRLDEISKVRGTPLQIGNVAEILKFYPKNGPVDVKRMECYVASIHHWDLLHCQHAILNPLHCQ